MAKAIQKYLFHFRRYSEALAARLRPFARRPGLSAVCLVYGLLGATALLHLSRVPEPQAAKPIAALSSTQIGEVGQECLALNIYHEARGESREGRVAVAQVVLNRVRDRRFPNDICTVVKQGPLPPRRDCHFSWWCDGRSDRPADLQAWAESKAIAEDVLAGRDGDPTGGALWYHAETVSPKWRTALVPAAKIGRHEFYLPVAEGARD